MRPTPGQRTCIFAFYSHWLAGETLHLTRDNYGCGGAGRALCGVETRSRDEFVRFLVDDEGLKASPVLAPFGSGCAQLVSLFDDLHVPQAVTGATDIAMRQHLPPDILAFTATKPMFEQLCALDERSFLHKPF